MPMNSGKDYVAREVEVAQPLMAAGPVGGNQGGDFIVQSVALRGREGGATAELGGETAYALRAADGGGSDPYVLAPTIAFSCKDHGANATEELAPTMRAMGHSASHANAAGQLAVCVTGDITHTLKAEGFDGSEDGSGRGQPIIAFQTRGSNVDVSDHVTGTIGSNCDRASGSAPMVETAMAVRRLMPVECERLQGFPDHYTLVPVGKKMAADGPRYKQLGNSWAVPHARWVGQRVADELARLDAIRPIGANEDDLTALIWALAA